MVVRIAGAFLLKNMAEVVGLLTLRLYRYRSTRVTLWTITRVQRLCEVFVLRLAVAQAPKL